MNSKGSERIRNKREGRAYDTVEKLLPHQPHSYVTIRKQPQKQIQLIELKVLTETKHHLELYHSALASDFAFFCISFFLAFF